MELFLAHLIYSNFVVWNDFMIFTSRSTLVFSKDNGKLVHFDSFGSYNSRHAVALQMKIGSLLKRMYSLYLIDIFLSP